MGRHGNRSGQCFSACSFRRPLTTSSASILIPSSNISPKHSFKTLDTTSCLDQRKKSLLGAPWIRIILWPTFSRRFVGVENGQPSAEPMMVLSYLPPLSWHASSRTPTDPKASMPYHWHTTDLAIQILPYFHTFVDALVDCQWQKKSYPCVLVVGLLVAR